MSTKRRTQRHRLNQRAYQNGFEAGADEATQRFEARLDRDNKAIGELVVKLTRAEIEAEEWKAKLEKLETTMRSQRLQCVHELAKAINGLL